MQLPFSDILCKKQPWAYLESDVRLSAASHLSGLYHHVALSLCGHIPVSRSDNLDLSTKRAKAAYDHIIAGGVPAGDNITYLGVGPHEALFDNGLPEGRALNRTVTVTLEYEQKE